MSTDHPQTTEQVVGMEIIERARRVFGDALAVRVNMNIRLGDVPAHVIREAIALALVEALSHD